MRRIPSLSIFLAFGLGLVLILGSCRKDKIDTDPSLSLSFSTDTLQFDTVFATVGSVTRSIRVINTHTKSVEVSSIDLAGGNASEFRINVDGTPGIHAENLRIAPNDSLWIFVEVTVDPTSVNTPFVIEDELLFVTNGNVQEVKLVAWGQEANFFSNESVGCDTTWNDEKPFVVYGVLQVDSGCTLTITEGCRIFMHGNSALLVDGTLEVLGTQDSMVSFEDDRLENEISDKPGMWDGIYFLRSSSGNKIEYCNIKNSGSGVSIGFSKMPYTGVPDVSGSPSLSIENSIIWNSSGSGITGFAATIDVSHSLIYDCGAFNVQLVLGGDYSFRHSTIVNYGSVFLDHKTPLIALANNFVDVNDVTFTSDLDSATFDYCAIDGNITSDEEIILSNVTGAQFNTAFRYNLIRTEHSLGADNLYNTNPRFEDRSSGDYSPSSSSPLVDAAIGSSSLFDLFGNPRIGVPDIGALEFSP